MLTKVHEEKGATAVFVTVVRKTRYVEKNVVGAARPKYRSKLKAPPSQPTYFPGQ